MTDSERPPKPEPLPRKTCGEPGRVRWRTAEARWERNGLCDRCADRAKLAELCKLVPRKLALPVPSGPRPEPLPCKVCGNPGKVSSVGPSELRAWQRKRICRLHVKRNSREAMARSALTASARRAKAKIIRDTGMTPEQAAEYLREFPYVDPTPNKKPER